MRVVVAGIGSPYSDDQAGWLVINQLAKKKLPSQVTLAKCKTPSDLLDVVGEADVLHVVDAYCRVLSVEQCFRRPWPLTELQDDPLWSSHGVGVFRVLKLAETLNMLPSQVTLWLIPAQRFGNERQLSSVTRRAVKECSQRLRDELAADSAIPSPCMNVP